MDLIERKQALDILDDYSKDVLEIRHGSYETARREMCELPSAEPTLYGYPIEHLAKIAAVMAAEHISPREAISIFKNAEELVNVVISEQQKIMKEHFLELAQSWQEELGSQGGIKDDP